VRPVSLDMSVGSVGWNTELLLKQLLRLNETIWYTSVPLMLVFTAACAGQHTRNRGQAR
jgi:hypothetical protein